MSTLNRTFSVKNGVDVANTIIIDSNRNLTNVGNVTPTGNNAQSLGSPTARFKDLYVGNSTIYIGETSLSSIGDELQANTFNAAVSFVSGGLNVLNQANTARNTANGAYAQANGAYAQANGAYAQANGAFAQANGAYAQANGAYSQANGAYSQANSAANTVRVSANGGSTLSDKQLNFINSASIQVSVIDAGDGNANVVFTTTGAAVADAYAQANSAYEQANTAREDANTTFATVNTTFGTVNTTFGTVNTNATNINSNAINAYARANAAYNTANAKAQNLIALGAIQIGSGQTNNVWSYSINVNTASTTDVGVTKLVDATDSTDTANAATANAVNATFNYAATKLPLTGGTISGDLTIDGNLYLSQNTTLINVSTYQVEDPLIYLASNNEISDTVDIGFMGGKNTGGTYAHTGLVRHAADQKYYLFDGLPDEAHTNNVINVAATYMATLKANIEGNSIVLMGNTVATQANLTLAHNQANTARDTANDAYEQANTARNTANDAYAQANTGYDQANAAYAQANAAYADSNTRVLRAGDTMTGALVVQANVTGANVITAAGGSLVLGSSSSKLKQLGSNATITLDGDITLTPDNSADPNHGVKIAGNGYLLSGSGSRNAKLDYSESGEFGVYKLNVYGGTGTPIVNGGANGVGNIGSATGRFDTFYGKNVNATLGVTSDSLQTGNANISYKLTVGALNVTTNTVATLASGQVVLDLFPATDLASVKYFVQAKSGADFHTTEVVLVQDQTNVWLTEYGSIQTGPSLGTFSADINSGNVRLLFNATNATNTIRSVRYGIAT